MKVPQGKISSNENLISDFEGKNKEENEISISDQRGSD